MKFLNIIFVGVHFSITVSDSYSAEKLRICSKCGVQFAVVENEQECPRCAEITNM